MERNSATELCEQVVWCRLTKKLKSPFLKRFLIVKSMIIYLIFLFLTVLKISLGSSFSPNIRPIIICYFLGVQIGLFLSFAIKEITSLINSLFLNCPLILLKLS